jgi:hypothetical protein
MVIVRPRPSQNIGLGRRIGPLALAQWAKLIQFSLANIAIFSRRPA